VRGKSWRPQTQGWSSAWPACCCSEITLLKHAVWIDVSRGGQGPPGNGDQQVRYMLQLDGWAPDVGLMEEAGYFDIGRLRGDIPGAPGS
jgi:hypothetical protein